MSDRHSSDDAWLSKLRNHLAEERYAARTSRQCITVARRFLQYLDKQHVDVSEAETASVEAYLQQARRTYRRRHGHPPDYKGWRCLHTNGIPHALASGSGPVATSTESGYACRDLAERNPWRVRPMDGRSARPRSGNGVSSLFRGRSFSRLAGRASKPRRAYDPHPFRCGPLSIGQGWWAGVRSRM